MKQYQLTEEHSSLGDFGITRRNILKAIGVTAVAGGVYTGPVAAAGSPNCNFEYDEEKCTLYILSPDPKEGEIQLATVGSTQDIEGVHIKRVSGSEIKIVSGADSISQLGVKGGPYCNAFSKVEDGEVYRTNEHPKPDQYPGISHVDIVICETDDDCGCPSGLNVKYDLEDLEWSGDTAEIDGFTFTVLDGDATDPKRIHVRTPYCTDVTYERKSGSIKSAENPVTFGTLAGGEGKISGARHKTHGHLMGISNITFSC